MEASLARAKPPPVYARPFVNKRSRSVMGRKRRPALQRIAFIGNSLPRQCGIATFTGDLTDALVRAYHQTVFHERRRDDGVDRQ